jgi:hypothetical protein
MERGLLWLPLLAVFIGLAWAGWNEFQKVEAYRLWAQPYQRAKYDLYAVLGQQGSQLTWGKPSRKGPVHLQTFDLQSVQEIQLWVDQQMVDPQNPPAQGRDIALEFSFKNADPTVRIPFTEVALAAQWHQSLQQQLQQFFT